jgi:hypothetical protein
MPAFLGIFLRSLVARATIVATSPHESAYNGSGKPGESLRAAA